MPTATVGMPTATAPVSAKPAGFTKPAGFGRPQAAAVEDDEPQGNNPVILSLSILALLVIAFVCYKQYEIDQMPNRQLDELRVFGTPTAGDADSDSGSSSSESDSDDSASASDDEDEDE